MWSETPRQLSQRGVRLHVNWVNEEDTNIFKDFIIPRWLSWRGVSLRVDSVVVESHSALTQLTRNEIPRQLSHRRMLKNPNNSANIQGQNQKPYYLAYMCSISAKNENKKISCKCTFKVPNRSPPRRPEVHYALKWGGCTHSGHIPRPPPHPTTLYKRCTSQASHWINSIFVPDSPPPRRSHTHVPKINPSFEICFPRWGVGGGGRECRKVICHKYKVHFT
jgi:hypothetical protein